MRIQHNIAALNSYRNLSTNNSMVNKNLEKLSSGYKINRAGDDAAGLAISEKMRAQITGLEVAQKNANDGISLVQTAEGALAEVHTMLNRMIELADQSANGTYDNDVDRANLQKEVASLLDEIDRIADGTNFNGIDLLNGDLAGASYTVADTSKGVNSVKVSGGNGDIDDVTVAITAATADAAGKVAVTSAVTGITFEAVTAGSDTLAAAAATSSAAKSVTFKAVVGNTASEEDAAKYEGLTLTVNVAEDAAKVGATAGNTTATAVDSKGLVLQVGDTSDDYNKLKVSVGDMHIAALGIDGIDVSSQDGASSAIDLIKTAINTVSSTRGDLGAIQNRLEHTINNLSVTTENMTAAESRIRDTDMAEEMMAYTKNNILIQASQAMLAQANQIPQGVLQLLQ